MAIWKRKRKNSLRLAGYNYSQPGGYFITVCTEDREHLFGEVCDGKMIENQYGQIIRECWKGLPNHYPNVELDEFVVMPNHIHGIVFVVNDLVGAIHESPLPRDRRKMLLSKIVGRFKMSAAKQINILRHTPGLSVWQRGFYDHIIRDERSLSRIREYITTNPERWKYDHENNARIAEDEFDRWLSSFLKDRSIVKKEKPE
ncbi:MAG TPA: transposase [Bacteroidota bacterium]|nr:transposase [Bacteroidota bacterium]